MTTDGYDIDKERDYMVAHLYLQLTALENLLIDKQIITDAELQAQLKQLAIRTAHLLGLPVEQLVATQIPKSSVIVKETANTEPFPLFNLTNQKVSKNN